MKLNNLLPNLNNQQKIYDQQILQFSPLLYHHEKKNSFQYNFFEDFARARNFLLSLFANLLTFQRLQQSDSTCKQTKITSKLQN